MFVNKIITSPKSCSLCQYNFFMQIPIPFPFSFPLFPVFPVTCFITWFQAECIIHSVAFSRGLFEAMDILYHSYFHFCCEVALKTWAKGSSIKPLKVHDLCHTHSLASLQWSELSNGWKLSTVAEEPFLHPFVLKNGPACANQVFSTAIQDNHRVHGMSWLCPLYTTFFARPIPIFKTNCTNR